MEQYNIQTVSSTEDFAWQQALNKIDIAKIGTRGCSLENNKRETFAIMSKIFKFLSTLHTYD